MNGRWKLLIWLGLVVVTFSFFRWLFGLAIPEIALSFAVGITLVLVGGLFSGYHAYKIWFKDLSQWQHKLAVALVIGGLAAFVGIGVLVNRMIVKTEFMEFAFTIMLLFVLSLSIGGFTGLVRNRVKSKIQETHRELEHSKSELQLLQSQLSPHFLFNTLNNVYGLSITDHERVPGLLLKLSDLLRYSVYGAKEMFVPLSHELEYLKNYIEFEKLRLGSSRLDLRLNLNVTDESFEIPPMLLVVFVENAFKHSRNTSDQKILIDIALSNTRNEMVFSITNSCFRSNASQTSEEHSGFGLKSVRKRLGVLYDQRHELEISESENEYTVNLKLKK